MTLVLEDLDHLFALVGRDLLGVPAVRDWLVLVGLDEDVSELLVGDVLELDPLHSEDAVPLPVLHPHVAALVLHARGHLCHTQELSGGVNTEEELEALTLLQVFKGLVQLLVAVGG